LNSQAGFLDKSRWSAAGLDSHLDREAGGLKLEYWKKSKAASLDILIVKHVYPLVAIPDFSNHDAAIVQGCSAPVGTDWWIEVDAERLVDGDLDVERILIGNVRSKARLLVQALYDALVSEEGNVGVFTRDNVRIADHRNGMAGGDVDKCLYIDYHPNKSLVCSVELQTGLFVISADVQGREDLFTKVEREVNLDLKGARDAFLRLRSVV
jgi:hypothetical protein